MRKLILPLICFITLATGGGALYAYLKTPQIIENNIKESFATLGFQDIQISEPEKRFGALRYRDITLDPDEFSTIETLELHYSPFLSFLSKHIQSIKITGLKLTGELTDQNSVMIAGWKNPEAMSARLTQLNTKEINFEKASLSLLSETLGGITLNGDLQLQNHKNTLKFHASLSGAQKQLSYKAKAEGQIGPEDQTQSRIEIEQAKFQLGHIKASRVAGLLNISASSLSDAQIVGELQAGAINIAELPWQNAAITLDGNLTAPSMIITAKSAGFEGIELGLNIENIKTPQLFSGDIHTEETSTLLDYLSSQNALPMNRENLALLDKIDMLDIGFERKNQLIFNLKNENQGINIKGNIGGNDVQNIQGNFTSNPFTPPETSPLKNGQLTLKSNFSVQEKTIKGELEADISSAMLSYGLIPLNTVSGSLAFKDIQNLNTNSYSPLSCKLERFKPEHECAIEISFKNGKARFKNLSISNENFEIKSPAYPGENRKTLIDIAKIDLKNILTYFDAKGWHGAGTLSGTAALEKYGDALSVQNLHLKSDESGILKIKDDAFFELLQMEEFEKETMKLALENFHFDLLEIRADGALPDQIKISVFGKGRNPYLMQGHDFSLDFEITPDLTKPLAELFED